MENTEIDKSKCCCKNCKWFEERTEFCRKNPPVPIQQYIKGVGSVTTSVFSKITLPALDWCSNFINRHILAD